MEPPECWWLKSTRNNKYCIWTFGDVEPSCQEGDVDCLWVPTTSLEGNAAPTGTYTSHQTETEVTGAIGALYSPIGLINRPFVGAPKTLVFIYHYETCVKYQGMIESCQILPI